MKLITKSILAAFVLAVAYTAIHLNSSVGASQVQRKLAIESVNGGDMEFAKLQLAADHYEKINLLMGGLAFLLVIGIFASPTSETKKNGAVTPALSLALLSVCALSGGCAKPYNKAVFEEIANNETGFLVPLEGDTDKQAKFDSAGALEKLKVSTKRIQITRRWQQTGREILVYHGEYIPTVRLIKVDRSPVTRQWDAEKSKSEAIWVESADSVGFSMGFNATAFVSEKDAATFLYWYPSGSLAKVMDTEIRGRIQQNVANYSAKYKLDELRFKKADISEELTRDIIPFYAERGITITTIGQFGGMSYEAPTIQDSINKVFIAQQLKNVAQAQWEAQQKTNDTITLAAQATKQATITEKEGEAEGIKLVTEALNKAAQNPLFIQSKALDVQLQQINRWNGSFPTTFMGNNPNLLLQVPTTTATTGK